MDLNEFFRMQSKWRSQKNTLMPRCYLRGVLYIEDNLYINVQLMGYRENRFLKFWFTRKTFVDLCINDTLIQSPYSWCFESLQGIESMYMLWIEWKILEVHQWINNFGKFGSSLGVVWEPFWSTFRRFGFNFIWEIYEALECLGVRLDFTSLYARTACWMLRWIT